MLTIRSRSLQGIERHDGDRGGEACDQVQGHVTAGPLEQRSRRVPCCTCRYQREERTPTCRAAVRSTREVWRP